MEEMSEDLNDEKILRLQKLANEIRILTIKSLIEAGSGHSAGPLGMADIFTALYFHIANQDPKNPDWEDRDRIVLSNGHICPIRYATMARAGYFPIEELKTLRKINSRLQGHPHRASLPGIENTSGPLGEGLSQAIGMALVGKLDKKDYTIYCLTSDGEHQEGNTWEAAQLAPKYKLNNLIQIIDRNYIQIDGKTEDIVPLDPLKEKYESFGWYVIEIDGNDMREIINSVDKAKQIIDKPVFILAKTIPGKGVSFMENDYRWHGAPPGKGPTDKVPADKQGEEALIELQTIQERLNNN